MGRFFRNDAPLMVMLSALCDLMILNALFLLCSLPLITIGTSLTAAFQVALAMANQSCGSIGNTFFRAFKDNFKQSCALWCLSLPVFVVLGLYHLIARSDPTMEIWLLGMLILCISLLAILCYAFPLIGRYQNTLAEHLKNAAFLAISHFPKTLALMAISILPVALLILYPGLFFFLLPFWILVGFAALIRLAAAIFRPVASRLDSLSSLPK